jgi:hypothetical protein
MSSTIDLNKQVYGKQQYQQVINTSFSELKVGNTATTTAAATPTVSEFFTYYSQLFYQIPKTGETNSHEYLVNQSSNYIGGSQTNEEVTALLQEITALREENLQLHQQLISLSKTNLDWHYD